MRCECWYHRYHVVHIYRNRIYDHSQGTWDGALKHAEPHEIETYPSSYYRHGMTADQLRQAAAVAEQQPEDARAHLFDSREVKVFTR